MSELSGKEVIVVTYYGYYEGDQEIEGVFSSQEEVDKFFEKELKGISNAEVERRHRYDEKKYIVDSGQRFI